MHRNDSTNGLKAIALLNGLVLKRCFSRFQRQVAPARVVCLRTLADGCWEDAPPGEIVARFRHAGVTQLEQGSQCAPYSRFEAGLRARLRVPYYLGHCRTPSWGDHSPAVLRGVHRMSSTSLRIGCFVSASTRCIATGTEKGWDVATGQHSLQSVEIDGDFGVKIGRRGTRAVWGLDG